MRRRGPILRWRYGPGSTHESAWLGLCDGTSSGRSSPGPVRQRRSCIGRNRRRKLNPLAVRRYRYHQQQNNDCTDHDLCGFRHDFPDSTIRQARKSLPTNMGHLEYQGHRTRSIPVLDIPTERREHLHLEYACRIEKAPRPPLLLHPHGRGNLPGVTKVIGSPVVSCLRRLPTTARYARILGSSGGPTIDTHAK